MFARILFVTPRIIGRSSLRFRIAGVLLHIIRHREKRRFLLQVLALGFVLLMQPPLKTLGQIRFVQAMHFQIVVVQAVAERRILKNGCLIEILFLCSTGPIFVLFLGVAEL